MKVIWTHEAESSFNDIMDYLLVMWTFKEAGNFIDIVESTERIVEHPKTFEVSAPDNQSREAFITKHTTMFYRILDEVVEIEYFWGNFQNPNRIREILKK